MPHAYIYTCIKQGINFNPIPAGVMIIVYLVCSKRIQYMYTVHCVSQNILRLIKNISKGGQNKDCMQYSRLSLLNRQSALFPRNNSGTLCTMGPITKD